MNNIRKVLLVIISLIVIITLSHTQQEENKTKPEKIKKGWNFGALPVISFNSDLGLVFNKQGTKIFWSSFLGNPYTLKSLVFTFL